VHNQQYPVIRAMDEVESEEEVKSEIQKLLEHILPDEINDADHRSSTSQALSLAPVATVAAAPAGNTSGASASSNPNSALHKGVNASSSVPVDDSEASEMAIGDLVSDSDEE
jgi:hypothetical protein